MFNRLNELNDRQAEAVTHTEGPLLILAGAGSGKTRVLTYRMAYLMEEMHVAPWHILAITFTNKAAAEMRSRVDSLIGAAAAGAWVSTFHAMCVRILRIHSERIGYDRSFSIYDTDDQRTLMRQVIKAMDLDSKMYRERGILAAISAAKNRMTGPEEYAAEAADFREEMIARIYKRYEEALRDNQAFDFDDLLLATLKLFDECPDVLADYRDRFRYIMVDEYQDTNQVQFKLVKALAGAHHNLCVVGDDDQSIYKFRGADIRNILSFEESFPGARVIKLEQNYRSTSHILDAANAVIRNNEGRKDKKLWTDNGTGEPIGFHQFEDGAEEAFSVVADIADRHDQGAAYSDFAVLYRTNAQSRLFEEQLVRRSIPYKLVGGVNFYARKEVKDILAYLKTIESGRDEVAVRRVINVPRRGIGDTTIAKIEAFAGDHLIGFWQAIERADEAGLGRSAGKVGTFSQLIRQLREKLAEIPLADFYDYLLEATGYREALQELEEHEAIERMDNLDELKSKLVDYINRAEEDGEEPSLTAFLQDVALVTDLDELDETSDYLVLMTLHGAKGLEFPQVYMTGMEEGTFPGFMTITSGEREEMEEERRLCYVGITRAMKRLTLTCARRRMTRGETHFCHISRFVSEIPFELFGEDKTFYYAKRQDDAVRERYAVPEKAGSAAADMFTKPKAPKQFSVPAGTKPEYDVGDRVVSAKFGEGTVTAMVEGGRDYEVTVDFDNAGTKKMFAAFAKLSKI